MNSVQSRSPQQPDDIVITVPASGMSGVVAAVERVRLAQREWGGRSAAERSAALTAAAQRVDTARDELIALAVREVGKPVTEATAELDRTLAILRYYAQQVFDPAGAVHEPSGTGLLFTRRRPLGVAGLITPWNFPFAIPVWKAAPALAAGNGVVLKPAPQATACAIRLFDLLAGALPDGLVAVVPGYATEGQVLTSTTDVVSFTGSVQAGTVVAARAVTTGVPVQAEMGGHNPAIVLPDADVDRAARHIVAAAYGYAGQKCTATRRIISVGTATEPLREALLMAIDELPCGDPTDPKTACGPVIEATARTRLLAAAREVREAGGHVLAGGTASGNLVAPMLVGGLSEGHALARRETFGPFCLLQPAADLPTAVEMANSGAYGLVSAVYTADLGHALHFVDELQTGLVKVNAPTTGVDFHLPFGGAKASSYGPPEQGKAAMDFYTAVRTVTVQPG
ncbi:aldehyde dehydrogenase family protein [Dactylosporangium sucinum]|uniref:Aldehyde dehydrogenase n=1 Tax=Dactylosporangium sucinum TaxID=1424081 RepID=A0A917T0K4_9ACTN|nr:aldehyde dehydrogenase family protein [Dactylosporangium sucinum]GGM04649.1 aldehyde dehydrogenase [Dactylosporangium sucinum]